MQYVYPFFGRIDCGLFRLFGPGLGNCLFSWARAMVFARRNNLSIIDPTWPNISIGAMVRNQADKRYYGNLFKPLEHSITGIKKWLLLFLSKKVWSDSAGQLLGPGDCRHSVVYFFKGMDNYFADIIRDHAFVKQMLIDSACTVPSVVLGASRQPFIAVHVRLGDFAKTKSSDFIKSGASNLRVPLVWYSNCINAVRKHYYAEMPVMIFSDGTDSELKPLLELPSTVRVNRNSALTDLFLLSRATILIASGSSYSMWASFLGRMPVIWHPGQLKQRLYYENAGYEIEFDGQGDLPDSFDVSLLTAHSKRY